VSERRETTERGSGKTDEGRGGTVETKRGERHLLSRSRLTGGGRTGAEKKLAKESKSRTVGVFFVRGEDESDRSSSLDQKTTSLLFSQGDSEAMLGEGSNGKGVGN